MTIRYEKQDRVRVITVDRPESANAIDEATHRELRQAWEEFRDDDDAWVAILTGSGTKAFSAGADLKEIDPAERARAGGVKRPFGGLTRDFETDKPIIAAINGVALGGGLEMALACDLRVASETAMLGLPEAKWALLPAGGGTQRLPRLVGPSAALELMLTAKPVTARRAYEIGLVNEVVKPEDLMFRVLELGATICANGPLAVRAIKQAVRAGMEMPLASGLAFERELSSRLYGSRDATEGPAAFREKRAANYVGA